VEDDKGESDAYRNYGGATNRVVEEQMEIERHEVQRAVSKLKNGKQQERME
jgi:hypothetical protein